MTTPENSKFAPGLVLLPLQASSHSRSLPGDRGRVLGGCLKVLHLGFGNQRGAATTETAQDRALISDEQQPFPFFSTHGSLLGPARRGAEAVKPPSYQVILTGGMSARAGKLK